MNSRITIPFILALVLVSFQITGVLEGQVRRQGPGFTIFYTADHDGEVDPCG